MSQKRSYLKVKSVDLTPWPFDFLKPSPQRLLVGEREICKKELRMV